MDNAQSRVESLILTLSITGGLLHLYNDSKANDIWKGGVEMSNINRKENAWPLRFTIREALGDSLKPLVLGWLAELMDRIENPVIFLYKKDDGSEYEFIEEKRDYKSIACKVCVKIRELMEGKLRACCCDCFDRKATEKIYLLEQGMNGDSIDCFTKWDRVDLSKDQHFYQYICPITGFTEEAVPIFLRGKIIGVIITGQFSNFSDDSSKSAEEISNNLSKRLSDLTDNEKGEIVKEITEALDEEKKKPNIVRGMKSGARTAFFIHIQMIQCTIENFYRKAESLAEHAIRSELQKQLWEVDDLSLGAMALRFDSTEHIEQYFEEILYKILNSVLSLEFFFGIESYAIYYPVFNQESAETALCVTGIDFFKWKAAGEPNHITGVREMEAKFSLLHEKLEIKIPLGHLACSHHSNLESILSDFKKESFEEAVCPSDLFIFQAKESTFLTAYLFSLQSSATRQNEYISVLKELLHTITAAYFAQWERAYAEWHRLKNKLVNQYLEHEVGSVTTRMQLRVEEFKQHVHNANEDIRYLTKRYGVRLSQQMEDFLYQVMEFSRLQSIDVRQVNTVSSNVSIVTTGIKPKIKVYSILERIEDTIKIYREKVMNRSIQISLVTNGMQDDQMDVIADPVLMDQVINNLMENATKYCHDNTRISIRLEIEEEWFLFSITNYGYPIEANEQKVIFELGRRGKYAELKSTKGIGFGLYIARRIIRAHGGEIELIASNVLSEMNISKLSQYSDIRDVRTKEDEAQLKLYMDEYIKLKANGVYEKVVICEPKISYGSIETLRRSLGRPTAEIIFQFKIPHSKANNIAERQR